MSAPLIREATAQDRPALVAMTAALQDFERALRPSRRSGSELAEEYVQLLEQDLATGTGRIFVAEREAVVIGFLSCFVHREVLEQAQPELVLRDVFVMPDSRRQGVGRLLVDRAVAYARELAIGRLVIGAITENRDALWSYRALGFAPAATTLERWL